MVINSVHLSVPPPCPSPVLLLRGTRQAGRREGGQEEDQQWGADHRRLAAALSGLRLQGSSAGQEKGEYQR